MTIRKFGIFAQVIVTIAMIASLSLVFLGVFSYNNDFKYVYRVILFLNLVTLTVNLLINKGQGTCLSKKIVLPLLFLTIVLSILALLLLFVKM
ncbi:MAG: hypothetical protein PT934_01465 [Peptoniphilaceae bacterium]|uniref:hypothetical protein n=1 Tax=Parvimonas sp. TaxID=1944660 RepID=UPI0025E09E2A|nr:hypothetical protein [Parvimonas sp.]MCI5997998.1 hypothetical protein [Parvimonas sp.]MDD7764416.1 hypothetical protein [Peptoniphilaceae bacterium]MDY3051374.1 hypothetical protein [Parvimonas sp.]